MNLSSAASVTSTWNGPRCQTCHRGYIGTHTCSVDDLKRQVDRLNAKIRELSDNMAATIEAGLHIASPKHAAEEVQA